MSGNFVYRLYSDVPDVVFDWLDAHARRAVVRWSGRGIGTGGWFYVTVVLDTKLAADQFERWLELRGRSGRLAMPVHRKDPSSIMTIENARWIPQLWPEDFSV